MKLPHDPEEHLRVHAVVGVLQPPHRRILERDPAPPAEVEVKASEMATAGTRKPETVTKRHQPLP